MYEVQKIRQSSYKRNLQNEILDEAGTPAPVSPQGQTQALFFTRKIAHSKHMSESYSQPKSKASKG